LVGVGDRHWLLAATDTHITPVAEISKDDLASFSKLVEQEQARRETP
jgi:hypothetical protein